MHMVRKGITYKLSNDTTHKRVAVLDKELWSDKDGKYLLVFRIHILRKTALK